VNQILKNLLSNAFKFTEQGEVSLKISEAKGNWKPGHPTLDKAKRAVSFSVSDTGIGIPIEKQRIIFEAFQQAEGSTSRKYGGTGLGLSISRGLVELLGGTIEVKSELGRGSTFTLFLPLEIITNKAPREVPLVTGLSAKPESKKENYLSGGSRIMVDEPKIELVEVTRESGNTADDDRSHIKANDKVILIAEHDLRFAKIMIEKAHEHGLKAIVAANYDEVFHFITKFSPIAITVDINLSVTNGWKVIQMLRSDLAYCHIPIHVISGEENRVLALKRGARSFLLKPLENGLLNQLFIDIISYDQKGDKHILIVEDNEIDASQIAKMLEDEKIKITIAANCKSALECISRRDYDCIILDYTVPDISGNDLIHEISKAKKIFTPVIIYSIKDFTGIEMNNVNFNSNSHIMKGVNSIEYLLAETVSQLHINHKSLTGDKQKIIENIRNQKDILNGKIILVVDDDVRNLFAMTTIFERFNMQAITAESGQEAIRILHENPRIEMVLMDIMMPEMDGYETIKQIRHEDKNSMLPIIAVTAKAMKQDREKCLEAGASDYIMKPVKTDQLLSLIRLWFCKQ
jgi:DNA-binding response OmpR family regulator